MSDEPTIKLLLKDPILDINGKPLKDPEKLREIKPYCEMTTEQFEAAVNGKLISDFEDILPNKTIGDVIKIILVNCIKAKNNEEAAKTFSYIIKINNSLLTAKGEWTLNKEDIEKLREHLGAATENINPLFNGQIEHILEQKFADVIKKQ